MDAFDLLVIVGILLIGVAVWLGLGLVAALAYAGTVLVGVGVMGAAIKQQGWQRGRTK